MPNVSEDVQQNWFANQWEWPMHNEGEVDVANKGGKFEVGLEVPLFNEDEIDVQVVGDEVVILCQQEEGRNRSGSVSRHLNRAYKLPPGVSDVKSELTNNGILRLTAQRKR